MKSLPDHRSLFLRLSEGLVSTGALCAWVFLQLGSHTFTASVVMAGLFAFWAALRPRASLCGLLVFAAVTPLLSSIAGVPWYSPAEGALLGVWTAASWRRGRGPALDNRGLAAGAFATYVAAALALLMLRFHYPATLETLDFLKYPLRDLLKLPQYTPLYAFRAVSVLLEGILAFHLFRRFSIGGGLLKPAARALVGAGAISALSFPLFWLPRLYNPSGNWMVFRSPLTLQDPNSAASFGLLVLAAGAALWWTESSGFLRWAAPVPGIAILLITGSRTANLLALVAAGCLVVLAISLFRVSEKKNGKVKYQRGVIWGGIGFFVLLLAVLGVLQSQSAGRYKKMFNPQALVGKGFSGRLGYWDAGLRMTAAYPLTGIGPGGFVASLHHFLDEKAYPYSSDYENAHSYPLQLAADLGIPGLLLWLAFLAAVFRPVVTKWRDTNPVGLCLAAGAGLYLLHCLQSHPLLIPEQQIFFYGVLGIIAGATVGRPVFRRGALVAGLSVVAAAGLIPAVWAGTPAAKEARIYGVFPASAKSAVRWSVPEAAALVKGDDTFHMIVKPDRLDLHKREIAINICIDGKGVLHRALKGNTTSSLDIRPLKRVKGYLVAWRVSPAYIPADWGPSRDDRRLGVPVTLEAAAAQSGHTLPPGAKTGRARSVQGFAVSWTETPLADIPRSQRLVSWQLGDIPKTLLPGAVVKLPITLRNATRTVWRGALLAGTDHALNLSYHWYNARGKLVVWDGLRTPVRTDIAPGVAFKSYLRVKAPDTPGTYRLQPDLVQENVGWFASSGAAASSEPLPVVRVAEPQKKS